MVRWTRLTEPVEKSSFDLAQIFEPIRADLERVDLEFGRHVQSQVDLIPKIGQYIQTSGGKRIRPAVLLMSARLCGYEGDRAILYAAVVDFIHTATLVHDDIIDDSDLRRGRLAVRSRWATTSPCSSATTSIKSWLALAGMRWRSSGCCATSPCA